MDILSAMATTVERRERVTVDEDIVCEERGRAEETIDLCARIWSLRRTQCACPPSRSYAYIGRAGCVPAPHHTSPTLLTPRQHILTGCVNTMLADIGAARRCCPAEPAASMPEPAPPVAGALLRGSATTSYAALHRRRRSRPRCCAAPRAAGGGDQRTPQRDAYVQVLWRV